MSIRIGDRFLAEGEQRRTFKVICIDDDAQLIHLHREPDAITLRIERGRLENMITSGAFKPITQHKGGEIA